MRAAGLVTLLGLMVFSIEDAHAYLDPGAASILLQGLIAGIASGLVILRLYWGKLAQMIGWRKPTADIGTSSERRD